MKIVQFCDLHHTNKPSILKDIIKCEEFALGCITPENPDLIAIAGDLFDEGVALGSEAAITAALFVQKCANIAPTILVRGTSTHDAEGQIALLDKIKAVNPIYVTDRLEQVALTYTKGFARVDGEVNGGRQKILISCLPSINKAGLMASIAGTVEETNRETSSLLRDVFQGWGIVNAEAHAGGIPTILVGHGTVTGSEFSSGQTATGKDLEFTVGDLELAGCDLVLMGHIHKAQKLGENVYYGGSITRLNYGEQEKKSVYVHHVTVDKVQTITYPMPAREMKTKRPEGLPTAELLADVQEGDNVRIVYTVSEEDIHKVDEAELERIALEKGAADVKIEKVIVPKVRVRAEGISQEHSLAGKLTKWAETTGQAVRQELVEKLGQLEQMNVEAITATYEEQGGSDDTQEAAA